MWQSLALSWQIAAQKVCVQVQQSLAAFVYGELIGQGVHTAGHAAMIHACTIEDGSLVGMGATLCDGCKVWTVSQ